MIFSKQQFLGAALSSALLISLGAPASAGPMSITPATSVSLPSLTADVAYRRTRHTVRHVRVHRHVRYRHYARGRHYYYRQNAFPAAALGLFGLGLGAAIASGGYDDWYGYGYPYGYGYGYPYYGGNYPSYSYGYAYPRYGYRHRIYGGYGGRGVIYNRPGMVRGGFAGRGFHGGMGGGGFRGGMAGGGGRGFGGGGGRGGHR
jgi:hypothetical protein